MTVPDLQLHPSDAAELAELLQLLDDWLGSDHDNLDASLTRFIGNSAYAASQLREDLRRFSFLLGTTDSEQLFGIQ